MIGRARTGTGKTLAFGIPIMDKIIRFNEKHGLVLYFPVCNCVVLLMFSALVLVTNYDCFIFY